MRDTFSHRRAGAWIGALVSALAAGAAGLALSGVVLALVLVAAILSMTAVAPAVARADWRGFIAWWRLQTRPLGKGTAVASLSAIWPALRRALRPDYVWVAYPGTEEHKRAYVPPWLEKTLRPVVPTGLMRFGRYWGIVVSSKASAESLERSPERVRALLQEIKKQFPAGVPIALAGRLPSIAASTGVGLGPPFTEGVRGTVCAMVGAAKEAARVLGRDPSSMTFAVAGSKGYIGSRLIESLAQEFGDVVALDSRYESQQEGDNGVLYTNLPEDVAKAEAIFVLTPKGADMEEIAEHVSPGTVVADDTHPEMPALLRARMEERGATVLKATLGDERFSFVPPIPDFRRDDIPGCLLEALVIIQRGEGVLSTQEKFNEAADQLGFRARLAPHRNSLRPSSEHRSQASRVAPEGALGS